MLVLFAPARNLPGLGGESGLSLMSGEPMITLPRKSDEEKERVRAPVHGGSAVLDLMGVAGGVVVQ